MIASPHERNSKGLSPVRSSSAVALCSVEEISSDSWRQDHQQSRCDAISGRLFGSPSREIPVCSWILPGLCPQLAKRCNLWLRQNS